GLSSGSAYVFVKSPGGWVDMSQTAKLTASDGAASDFFGASVSISGEVAVIGAAQGDGNVADSGSAYVFMEPVGGWVNMTQTAKLTASDGAASDFLGASASISGDVLVIGARNDDDNGFNSGSAYVFEKPLGGWVNMTQTSKHAALDGLASDSFGISVSISGDLVVVGDYFDDDNGSNSGSAYVYDLAGVDCNLNGLSDACDIVLGISCDFNANLIPDECELAATAGDISGPGGGPDGCVDAFDLGALLAAWCSVAGGNPCGTCSP
ncbi:MAG: FG-GAP repeat protein, partial [Planctomycetota bacterium]|nr:FG-GAP repeat protein [Planctomycetota bacterium]